jgi:hypothetical protein
VIFLDKFCLHKKNGYNSGINLFGEEISHKNLISKLEKKKKKTQVNRDFGD